MKILVLGDYIQDRYVFGTATRLCPEAPVPVIVPRGSTNSSGGAGLVYRQLFALEEITSGVTAWYGSWSRKERIYAGSHLVCRIDKDSENAGMAPWRDYMLAYADAIVVCDYSKGALTPELARKIVDTGKPCFVDAKNHWPWYEGPNVTIFPNSREAQPAPEHIDPAKVMRESQFKMIVHKLGDKGCRLQDGKLDITLPASVDQIVDVCGAGDIFMAAFVYAWSIQLPTAHCLEFANILAGRSCQFLGTHVVDRGSAQSVLDRLRTSRESAEQAPENSPDSNSREHRLQQRSDRIIAWHVKAKELIDNPPEGFPEVVGVTADGRYSPPLVQILPQCPSGPTEQNATPTPSDQGSSDGSDTK